MKRAAAVFLVVSARMLSPAAEIKPLGATLIEPFDDHGVSLHDGRTGQSPLGVLFK